jgi:hypothetical protein
MAARRGETPMPSRFRAPAPIDKGETPSYVSRDSRRLRGARMRL